MSLSYRYRGMNTRNMNIAKAMMQTIYTFAMQVLYNPSTYSTANEHVRVLFFVFLITVVVL